MAIFSFLCCFMTSQRIYTFFHVFSSLFFKIWISGAALFLKTTKYLFTARYIVRSFGIRHNEKIAVYCTVRGPKEQEILERGLKVSLEDYFCGCECCVMKLFSCVSYPCAKMYYDWKVVWDV